MLLHVEISERPGTAGAASSGRHFTVDCDELRIPGPVGVADTAVKFPVPEADDVRGQHFGEFPDRFRLSRGITTAAAVKI